MSVEETCLPMPYFTTPRKPLRAAFLGTLSYGNRADVENLPNQCPKIENMFYV
jgi:hypothetical protein